MKAYLLFAGFLCLIPISAHADETVAIPARCPIDSIHMELFRAENSKVTIASNRSGTWITDGESPELWQHGSAHARFDYKPHTPSLFAASRCPYLLRIGGSFSTGSWQGRVKPTETQYPAITRKPDQITAHLYGGTHESPNTDVTIVFKHPCLSSR